MFDIRPMPPSLPDTLLARARLAEPATIGHFRLRGFPDGGTCPITGTARVVGTAVTLAMPAFDGTVLLHASGLVRPGDILMIDRLGDTIHACLGGGVARCLARMGLTAAIIDGPCTDPQELRDSGLPIWARGVSAITTRKLGIGGAMNVPVSIGGAVVMPGDLVIADEAGIVILPLDECEADIERAIILQAAEPAMIASVSRDNSLGAVTGASELVAGDCRPDSPIST